MGNGSWLRVVLLGVVLLFLTGQSRAESVSAHCPGYDSDPPYPTFSAQKTASWQTLNLAKIVIHQPSLTEVQVGGERRFKVIFNQITPQCYVSGHVWATVINNGVKSPQIQLFQVLGARNFPDPPQPFEMMSAQAIPPGLNIDETTQVYLSLDCGCIKDPGARISPQRYMIPLGKCDFDFNCEPSFGTLWNGTWPHR